MPALSKEVFKYIWDSEDGDVTLGQIAECAIAWGVDPEPRSHPPMEIIAKVLAAAGIDLEAWIRSVEEKRSNEH